MHKIRKSNVVISLSPSFYLIEIKSQTKNDLNYELELLWISFPAIRLGQNFCIGW